MLLLSTLGPALCPDDKTPLPARRLYTSLVCGGHTPGTWSYVHLMRGVQVSAAILGEPHALDALLALGWEKSPGAAGGEPEVLVAQRVFTMADVRLVEEAKDALKKAQRDALTKTVRPPGAVRWPLRTLWEPLPCVLQPLCPGAGKVFDTSAVPPSGQGMQRCP